ncbi:MAG: alpha/beta fold hydrolase [Mesorhizobium sp.]
MSGHAQHPRRIQETISQGGLEFAAEAFGHEAGRPLLLIMGATASMLWWPEELCEALADRGHFVIRYDNRDTGRSTTGEPGQPPYSIDDMAEDAVAIMDGYGIAAAHVAGMSLGGMIAQILALRHPERVLSLTAISSSRIDEDDPSLPELDPRLLAHFTRLAELDWQDRESVVSFFVESFRISAGATSAFDAEAARRLAEHEFDRARDIRCAMNHQMLTGGESFRGQLSRIDVPALVIHGRNDPILSHAHGRRLSDVLPNSAMVTIEEAGHELNRRDWPRIVDAIADHTAAAERGA